mmetsp:Transcript_13969/g.33845  ORF Transcript_13969/g.33845 Transcript_13969/m.33845 type:complete len:155 (-) Transcript_13969:114-578(-)
MSGRHRSSRSRSRGRRSSNFSSGPGGSSSGNFGSSYSSSFSSSYSTSRSGTSNGGRSAFDQPPSRTDRPSGFDVSFRAPMRVGRFDRYEEEVDPLDAYMAGIDKELGKNKKKVGNIARERATDEVQLYQARGSRRFGHEALDEDSRETWGQGNV